ESELQALRLSEATLRKQVTEAQEQLGTLEGLPAKLEQASAALTREAARAAVAEAKGVELQGELHTLEEERKDLSRALAEVEAELSRLSGELTHERGSRGSIAEELVGAKEALSLAQDRVAELEAERAEMQGALEAVREQYQANLAELEHTGGELRAAWRERERVEAELAASEAEGVRLRDQREADAAALSQAAEQAEARVAELEGELKAAEADRQDLARALEASRSQGPEPEPAAELLAERDQLKEDVAAMKRKLMAAEAALESAASYKMKVARLEAQLAQLRGAK
ncbi:MAG: gliding motility protein, partial [Archangium sp.]